MSLVEWFGERLSSGPIGTVETGAPDPGHWHPRLVVARGILGTLVLGLAVGGLISVTDSVVQATLALGSLGVYCFVAYHITPHPDYANVGWLRGLVNNPFRISDDLNRWLVLLRVLLWPGRFVTVSLRDLGWLLRGRRVLVLPTYDE